MKTLDAKKYLYLSLSYALLGIPNTLDMAMTGYLLGLLVDQSSVARLDLYGEHLGGRHPAGLVPGSYSSDTQDEVSVIVLFSVLCKARFKSFCARCPFYFSRDIVPARC